HPEDAAEPADVLTHEQHPVVLGESTAKARVQGTAEGESGCRGHRCLRVGAFRLGAPTRLRLCVSTRLRLAQRPGRPGGVGADLRHAPSSSDASYAASHRCCSATSACASAYTWSKTVSRGMS